MQLTPDEQRALKRLTDQWQSARELQTPHATLNSLMTKGYAQRMRCPPNKYSLRPTRFRLMPQELKDKIKDKIKATDIVEAIEELRKNEGAAVIINCDNPEGEGHNNVSIQVIDDWTDWNAREFYAESLVDALQKAVQAKQAKL